MSAKIIDGEPIARQIRQQAAKDAAELTALGYHPRLVAVQVGRNPASMMYVNMQRRTSRETGVAYDLLQLPRETTQAELLGKIEELNTDPSVTGIILQMPLPVDLDAREAQIAITPTKDVEGMHPENMGRLFTGTGTVAPCTAAAAVALLQEVDQSLAGEEVVVVGHSEIVGKPIATMLLQSYHEAPTVTVCHVATRNLTFHTCRADVVIVATGVSQARWLNYTRRKAAGEQPPVPDLSPLIGPEILKEGAIVIDVAINRIPKTLDANGEPILNEKGKPSMMTVGDVDYLRALPKVSAITKVPGGVGPVTVAMLLRNTLACARRQIQSGPA